VGINRADEPSALDETARIWINALKNTALGRLFRQNGGDAANENLQLHLDHLVDVVDGHVVDKLSDTEIEYRGVQAPDRFNLYRGNGFLINGWSAEICPQLRNDEPKDPLAK
jgi:hypothetical protein